MRLISNSGRLLAAAALSCFGDGVQLVAFPLIGASLTEDPRVIGALAAVGALPSLVGSLPAGAIADRVRRARVMVTADLIRVAALGVFLTISVTGHLAVWQLFILALLLGTGQVFFDISSSALVPEVVPVAALSRFNGYLASIQEAGNGLVGPACAGFLYAASRNLPFAVNGATFLLSALIIGSIIRYEAKVTPTAATAPDRGTVRELASSARDGTLWLLSERPMLALAIVIAGWSVFGWIPESVLVLYVKEDLHGTSVVFGVMLAAAAAGAVLGGIMASRIVGRLDAARVLAPCLVLYGLCLLPPVFLSNQVLVGIDFFVQGFPVVIFSVASVTVRQTLVPGEMLGRVTSVFYLVGAGLSPVGLLLGGIIGQWTGLRSTFLFGSLGIVLTTLILARPLSMLSERLQSAELAEVNS